MTIPLKDKFIAKYMRQAIFLSKDNNPCYSRGVASIIIDVKKNSVISQGYNGPPKGVPHCNSEQYVENYLIPMMNDRDKEEAKKKIKEEDSYCSDDTFLDGMCRIICGTKKCPRQILGYQSGERLELCACSHAEENAIAVAGQDLYDTAIFVSAGVPCYLCCRKIINSGIKYVFCLGNNYPFSEVSLWMLKSAGLMVYRVNQDWVYDEENKNLIKYTKIS